MSTTTQNTAAQQSTDPKQPANPAKGTSRARRPWPPRSTAGST